MLWNMLPVIQFKFSIFIHNEMFLYFNEHFQFDFELYIFLCLYILTVGMVIGFPILWQPCQICNEFTPSRIYHKLIIFLERTIFIEKYPGNRRFNFL